MLASCTGCHHRDANKDRQAFSGSRPEAATGVAIENTKIGGNPPRTLAYPCQFSRPGSAVVSSIAISGDSNFLVSSPPPSRGITCHSKIEDTVGALHDSNQCFVSRSRVVRKFKHVLHCPSKSIASQNISETSTSKTQRASHIGSLRYDQQWIIAPDQQRISL